MGRGKTPTDDPKDFVKFKKERQKKIKLLSRLKSIYSFVHLFIR